MAACVIRPLTESSAAPLRVEEFEVAPGPTSSAERFLEACGTTADQALSFGSKAQEAARRDGRALLQVTVGPGGTQVKVLTDLAQARLAA
jgi:hypothetical protein